VGEHYTLEKRAILAGYNLGNLSHYTMTIPTGIKEENKTYYAKVLKPARLLAREILL
jgi:hypothetical protein